MNVLTASSSSNLQINQSHGFEFTAPIFQGPLDLLLHLIRANKVDIYDIPVAEITSQYLSYMSVIEALDLGMAGEYLVIAATLIEIKSRLLLPAPPASIDGEEAEDPRAELVARLVEYQQYQGCIDTFRTWEELRRSLYFRDSTGNADDYSLPVPQGEAHASQLLMALQRLLADAGVEDRQVTSIAPRKRLTLRIKMAEVLRITSGAGSGGIEFEMLFSTGGSRYEIVITFLAVLELIRLSRIDVRQTGTLTPITLHAIRTAVAREPETT